MKWNSVNLTSFFFLFFFGFLLSRPAFTATFTKELESTIGEIKSLSDGSYAVSLEEKGIAHIDSSGNLKGNDDWCRGLSNKFDAASTGGFVGDSRLAFRPYSGGWVFQSFICKSSSNGKVAWEKMMSNDYFSLGGARRSRSRAPSNSVPELEKRKRRRRR